MSPRQVILEALRFRPPPYVPWHVRLTAGCAERLRAHLGTGDLDPFLGNHFFDVRCKLRSFEPVKPVYQPEPKPPVAASRKSAAEISSPLGKASGALTRRRYRGLAPRSHLPVQGENAGGEAYLVRDQYGVVWDRTVDADIGTPVAWPIRSPADLDHYRFPDAADDAWYQGLTEAVAAHRHCFTRYSLAMCLYERAWALRGFEDLLLDLLERPAFFERLLDAILEHHLVLVHKALALGVDCVHFGDDYGMQTGLILGLPNWRKFIKPRLARLFAPVRAAGKFVSLHSCGQVQSLFDDLTEIGLDLFNPFQPEVMDVFAELPRQRGKLAFHGGLSLQRTLPFGTVAEVRAQTRRLLEAGRPGGYIFAPAHDVPRDVPPENLVAMMEVLRAQPGAS